MPGGRERPREITSTDQVPRRDNFTPVSQTEGLIKSISGYSELSKEDQDALLHYAGTIAYHLGMKVHSQAFANPEDRHMMTSGLSINDLVDERGQLSQTGIPERFIHAADLIGLSIAVEWVAERAERAMQNTQDLYRRTSSLVQRR